jgi:hypothetical protein
LKRRVREYPLLALRRVAHCRFEDEVDMKAFDLYHIKGRSYGFHQKDRQTIVMPEAEQLVFLSLRRHAKEGCSLLAFRRNFIALVFLVYVTRPFVVTAVVYDEQSLYYFMAPCKGVPTPFIST